MAVTTTFNPDPPRVGGTVTVSGLSGTDCHIVIRTRDGTILEDVWGGIATTIIPPECEGLNGITVIIDCDDGTTSTTNYDVLPA